MDLITKKDIQGLDDIHSVFCISIYIPTHKVGQEVLRRQDALLLKNQLKEVKNKLVQEALSTDEIKRLVSPIQALIDDTEFWRHRAEGLALFLTDGIFKNYTLPISFEPFNQVANSFYLQPLMPFFTGNGSFYVLAIELEKVTLYAQTRYSNSEVSIEDLIPARIEDEVGFDYEPKGLQFRSPQGMHGVASIHGTAGADNERKEEILRYFRGIDKGLMTLLHEENKPMILACQDFMSPIYHKVNTYQYLLKEHISCNLSETDMEVLHQLSWKKVEPIFDSERKEKMALFMQYEGKGKTSSDIGQVLPAALEGKIDALFLERNADIWGVYDPEKKHVRVDETPLPSNVSLLDKVAIKTFLKGGKVYLMDREDMPDRYSKVNALYRY
tara:strand:+ start:967 stop:2121 length:1155 start_codon:yes stop_codon:yes gene_type:complete